jgi:FtsP/CotA-like multicopper oxidase with cupredoxin domain
MLRLPRSRLRLLLLVMLNLLAGTALLGPLVVTGRQFAQARPRVVDGLEEWRSSGGVLAVTLHATPGRVHIGALELPGATYNGIYSGPVLRVHPGDLLRIRLVNDLTEPTNLHFHGIRTSPLGNSDNVHILVPAGGSFTYEVRVPPTQPPGTYWYHAHPHGWSEAQVEHGLSGALIVDPAQPPAMPERLFVLKDMVFDDDTGNDTVDDELHGIVQAVNGRLAVDEAMHPGETQLWRFTNQSANRLVHLALQGHRMRIVAEDGETTLAPRDVDAIDVNPASRVDVLVDAGDAGSYALIEKGLMTGTGSARRPHRVLGHLVVAGAAVPPAAAPATEPPPPDLRVAGISARRTVVFTETKTLKAKDQKFFVNGRLFDIDRVDVRVPLGSIEEWTIRNDSDDMHVFHIHQLGFQVVEVNGVPAPFTGRLDNVRVPERGEVKLRIPFTDKRIVGRFMFHCHVLKHEDKGMMAQIEVFQPHARDLPDRLRATYFHVWWWLHGVPWALCGIADA